MIEKCELELELINSDKKILKAIAEAVKPDTRDLPEKCIINLNMSSDKLIIKIICEEISDLRTLFFSYYTIISTIMDLGEVLNESAETASRSSANTSSVSSN